MRTVKQVSELTGISVRSLHYYDEIGLFKPSEVTDAGYRLYDDNALQILQQILFFRELDFSLKDIKAIMRNPAYDQKKVFENQRRLIQMKRDRLNGLLTMLDKLIEGEEYMSFKEFDMSGYTAALEEFVKSNADEIVKYGGDVGEFNRVINALKSDSPKKAEAAGIAIKQFGSIEKYTEVMKKNMVNFPALMEQMYSRKDNVDSFIAKSNELMKRLTADLSKDAASEEIQQMIGELIAVSDAAVDSTIDMGYNYWEAMVDNYMTNSIYIEITDKKYGSGASAFIGNALKVYWNIK